jgi:hypothetical protein
MELALLEKSPVGQITVFNEGHYIDASAVHSELFAHRRMFSKSRKKQYWQSKSILVTGCGDV